MHLVLAFIYMESFSPVRLDRLDTRSLEQYFQNTWALYEWLFSGIRDDKTLYLNPDPLRHPLIFYLGHTAVFYINKLVIAGLLPESKRINPAFELLFEQGVDPASSQELATEKWPKVQAVREYRQAAYVLVLDFIRGLEEGISIDMNHPLWSIFMALEHDRIHFETSSMLIRQYPVALVQRPVGWGYAPFEYAISSNDWITVPESRVQLGKPFDFPTFGWDNEYGALAIAVPAFEASRNLVTNGEFHAFVAAGGYQNPYYWTTEGWEWRSAAEVQEPKFWEEVGGEYHYRTMFELVEMPENWPVEVNQHEANAYCAWKGGGARLLTEAEFQAIAQTAIHQPFDLPFENHYNLNIKFGSPTPVGMLQEAGSALGFNDVWGNVWCWLSNDFYGLPGFKPHPYYDNFSEPYMDTDHAMLLGGSWASSGTSASRYYRLWFRRNFYQHAGFRLARTI